MKPNPRPFGIKNQTETQLQKTIPHSHTPRVIVIIIVACIDACV